MVNGSGHHAEALRAEVAAALAPPGLRLAEEKTRVVHIDEGFDFLSFTIRRMRKKGTSRRYLCTIPSKKAIQAVKARVSEMTYRSTRNQGPEVLIQNINRSLTGWANYFRHGVSKAVFNAVDARAWRRIMRWIRHKYKHGNTAIGMPELRRRLFRPGTWQFAGQHSQVHRRIQRRGHPLPLSRQQNTDPVDTPADSSQLTSGKGTRRARCGASRTAGRPGPTQLVPPTVRAIKQILLRHPDLQVPRQSGDREHHARRGAELRFCDAAVDEAGSAVKSQRVRIGGHLQAFRTPCPQDLCDAVDERSGNSAPPIARVHEQVFQF
jgi:hypothetical protein